MGAKIHEWNSTQIVTLKSEYWTWETIWDNASSKTFAGSVFNILRFNILFKYKKPYGGSARYRIHIDTKSGENWNNVITDEINFFPEPTDTNWHSSKKPYELSFINLLWYKKNYDLNFRITTQIEGPGYLPTGSSGGSLGVWSNPETKYFVATFKKPTSEVLDIQLKSVEDYFNVVVKEYRKKFLTKR